MFTDSITQGLLHLFSKFLTSQKKRDDRAKISFAGHCVRSPSKNYFEPCMYVKRAPRFVISDVKLP